MLNKIFLIGNVGKDIEMKYTASGKAVAKFTLATTETYNGNKQTTWHNIVVWMKTAEIAAQYCKKGDKVFIEGKITNRSWDKKDGSKAYITEIVCHRLLMLGNKKEVSEEIKADDEFLNDQKHSEFTDEINDEPLPF